MSADARASFQATPHNGPGAAARCRPRSDAPQNPTHSSVLLRAAGEARDHGPVVLFEARHGLGVEPRLVHGHGELPQHLCAPLLHLAARAVSAAMCARAKPGDHAACGSPGVARATYTNLVAQVALSCSSNMGSPKLPGPAGPVPHHLYFLLCCSVLHKAGQENSAQGRETELKQKHLHTTHVVKRTTRPAYLHKTNTRLRWGGARRFLVTCSGCPLWKRSAAY